MLPNVLPSSTSIGDDNENDTVEFKKRLQSRHALKTIPPRLKSLSGVSELWLFCSTPSLKIVREKTTPETDVYTLVYLKTLQQGTALK